MEQALGNRKCACGHAEHNHVVGLTGGRWTCLILMCPCRQFANAEAVCESLTERPSGGMIHDDGVIQGKNGICKCGHYEDIHRWSGGCCSALGCACQGFVEFKLVDPAQPPGRNHAWEAKPECPLSGHPRFYEILDRLKDLHSRKAAAYEGTNPPYTNYKRAGERWFGGRTGAVRYALMRLEEKLERIRNLILDETLPASSESLNDNLEDIAVIAIIAEILYEELADGKVEK